MVNKVKFRIFTFDIFLIQSQKCIFISSEIDLVH